MRLSMKRRRARSCTTVCLQGLPSFDQGLTSFDRGLNGDLQGSWRQVDCPLHHFLFT